MCRSKASVIASSMDEDSPLGSFGTAIKMINEAPTPEAAAQDKLDGIIHASGHGGQAIKKADREKWRDWPAPPLNEIREAAERVAAEATFTTLAFREYVAGRQDGEGHAAALERAIAKNR
jgi:hypothetical protein